ncbi:protein bride of sevenless [Dendroctonus ponderosae]|uniref:protein bride of sevenless n=1 Tax=Dendroctonus ponderosae TaxID=77166 RepID=UPI002034EBF4|nr:protein bride of sevenless [Dendroctonus ponderosae]KAH1017328.1 hypothetical protein HUJ05_007985 [Dendroctonus ponderosae]
MFFIKILIGLLSVGCGVKAQNITKLFGSSGDVSVVVIIHDCDLLELSASRKTVVNSAIWLTERISFLEILHPLKLGVSVYQACSEVDYLKTLLEIYENDATYVLGVVTSQQPSEKVRKFSEILHLRSKNIKTFPGQLVKAAVKLLASAGWKRNVVLLAKDDQTVDFFYHHAKASRVCVKKCFVYEDSRSIALNASGEDPLVLFGTASDIDGFIANGTHFETRTSNSRLVLVPLDGEVSTGMPEGSFIILPPHSAAANFQSGAGIFPTPLMFEVGTPLANFVLEARRFIAANCNDTIYKVNCLRSKPFFFGHLHSIEAPLDLLKFLQIDELQEHFVYDIFQVEALGADTNHSLYFFRKPLRMAYSYHVFFDNLTLVGETVDVNDTSELESCPREFVIRGRNRIFYRWPEISFRSDAWIYAILSLALLGVLFCSAILAFLLVAIFQKRILEGNPVLTLLLLLAVMMVFCSVLPFTIENTQNIRKSLCIIKALAITMSYAAVFSLLLSRSIVLSSAAREVGFMSHIAGPVQSFLCLFIFGVQAALSLHVFGRCHDIFTQGYELVYLMSYNTVLLILLICLSPLMYKSQRNYREGKYFTVTAVMIALVWSVWLPGFMMLCNEWKEMMVCLGLVATGSICLGAIFIPRTYLMTIAAERDKITSALPSLATANSSMDIYRTHAQPIYDCINIAAINAAAVARAGITPTAPAGTLQQPDLYSCPALPEDIDFDMCCESPANTDKVTRF